MNESANQVCRKGKSLTLLLLSLLALSGLQGCAQNPSAEESSQIVRNSPCPDFEPSRWNVALPQSISALTAEDLNVRETAIRELLSYANSSPTARTTVLASIRSVIEDPDFKCRLSQNFGSRLWISTAQMLGELKAVEDLDLLIDRLNWPAITEISSETYRDEPAIGALSAIGESAIPRLSVALKQPDPQIRRFAALCLSNIGGKNARQSLTDALRNEPNSEIRSQFQNAIDTIDRLERARRM